MSSSQQQILSIPEIENLWDNYSEEYIQQDGCTNVLYLTLINMLRLESRKNILEVGAGAGFLFDHTMKRKQPDAQYTATDLSENMLKILYRRYGIEGNPDESAFCKTHNLRIEKANGEELKYADNSFDCYIANLCLQITSDPVKMVAESYRVLQKGGVVGFSVCGNMQKSHYFQIVTTCLAENGVQLSNARNMFHLNDRDKLIQMLEIAGFTNIICWDQFIPYVFQTDEELQKILRYPNYEKLFSQAGEKKEEVRSDCFRRLLGHLTNKKLPLGLDGLLIIATKI